ncbi:DUF975 family protein [Anoxybacterium hadale]|uniref:DUF975 family protein n=1 Tax=Anoxybacterium hadale TaxID=3408580 RepID=A0ACD1A9U0_9FIRM|nr:DUF975 family protein [Clostridiales bacterium]
MDQNIIITESCRNLRALGRDSLTGKWGLGALGTLLYMVLALLPVFILNGVFGDFEPTTIANIYSILISGPLTLGYAMFAISLFRRRETSPAEVFYGFERFGKAFGLYIVMSIFIVLWMLLLFIPGIIAALRYSMSFYILADHPEMGIMEALNESKRLMRGNKWKLFCLYLSFLGWAILSAFTLGIGYLWLMPYMEVTIVAFYDIAKGNLRSVSRLDGWQEEYNSTDKDTKDFVDPITVYRTPETSSVDADKANEMDQQDRRE